MHPRLILASGSIYRKELFSRLHVPFDAIAPNIDESIDPHESAENNALRLAKEKAIAVAQVAPDAIVIGSDQIASMGPHFIGKPYTHKKALGQLLSMQGKEVIFHTALCVYAPPTEDKKEATVEWTNTQTIVQFRTLSEAELDAYLHIEQPYDCAGSAKNEGLGITLLEKVASIDPTALTGLPLIALTTMLRKIGVTFFKRS